MSEKPYLWTIKDSKPVKVEILKETKDYIFTHRVREVGYGTRHKKSDGIFYYSEAEAKLALQAGLKSSLEHHRQEVKRLEELLKEVAP